MENNFVKQLEETPPSRVEGWVLRQKAAVRIRELEKQVLLLSAELDGELDIIKMQAVVEAARDCIKTEYRSAPLIKALNDLDDE